ncbi:MAG: hypothetical protein KDA84_03175 [Planctomycetaceae bacterium]|nr:hypothetical protein [Planctomycetaceae bacterium]
MEPDSGELLQKHRAGDQEAAELIFQRFVIRLVGLVRTLLFSKVNRRVDPGDVAQSAFRRFFRNPDSDRFAIEKSGDFWRLLAAIAVNKVRRQNEFHTAANRAVNRENEGKLRIEFRSRCGCCRAGSW